MGKQAAVVMGALIFVHIAVILLGIGLGTPYWLESEAKTNETLDNSTQTTHKGFWQICVDNNCTKLNDTNQEGWFESSKYIYTTATVLCVLAVFGNYCFFLCGQCQKSQFCNGINFILMVLSGALQIAVLSQVGANLNTSIADLDSPVTGWSYNVAVAAVVATFVTAILHLVEQCYLRNRQDGYESI